jgi:hypothetical protein
MLWANAEFALAEAEQLAGDGDGAKAHYETARATYAALAGDDHPAARECARRLAQIARPGTPAG